MSKYKASKNTVAAINAEIEAKRIERERSVQNARLLTDLRLANHLSETATIAAQKLRDVLEGNGPNKIDGSVDAAFVNALRLALQAGGALIDRKDVTSGGDKIQGAFVVPTKDSP